MNIAGIIKSSFIDYPGFASIVIFLGGCNFKCGYCHNPEIVRCGRGEITLPDFFAFLKKRKRFIDAVCISGGEPTIHRELFDLICEIRRLGFRVKLDTNGTNPRLLARLLAGGIGGGGAAEGPLVNYVAMDIKGPWEKYGQIAGLDGGNGAKADKIWESALAETAAMAGEATEIAGPAAGGQKAETAAMAGEAAEIAGSAAVRESLELLKQAAAPDFSYELRTTICRELISAADIETMAGQLSGAAVWYLQPFKKQGELLCDRGYSAYTPEEMGELLLAARKAAQGRIGQIRVRE